MTGRRLLDEHAEATREAIFDSAEQLFTELGYQATSLERIALQSGVTKGAIYHHFSSKKQLFEKIYERVAEDLCAELESAIATETQPKKTIARAIDVLLDRADDARVRRIVFHEGPLILGEQCREIDERLFLGLLGDLLGDLQKQGQLPGVNVSIAGQLLFSLLVECTVLLGASDNLSQTRREVRAVLDALLSGLIRSRK